MDAANPNSFPRVPYAKFVVKIIMTVATMTFLNASKYIRVELQAIPVSHQQQASTLHEAAISKLLDKLHQLTTSLVLTANTTVNAAIVLSAVSHSFLSSFTPVTEQLATFPQVPHPLPFLYNHVHLQLIGTIEVLTKHYNFLSLPNSQDETAAQEVKIANALVLMYPRLPELIDSVTPLAETLHQMP